MTACDKNRQVWRNNNAYYNGVRLRRRRGVAVAVSKCNKMPNCNNNNIIGGILF